MLIQLNFVEMTSDLAEKKEHVFPYEYLDRPLLGTSSLLELVRKVINYFKFNIYFTKRSIKGIT